MADDAKPGYHVAADGHTYHKSATANATTAPTNEVTINNAAKTKGLSAAQAEFVTICDYEWQLRKNLDPEFIQTEYGYTSTEYENLISTESIQVALEERGIDRKWVVPNKPESKQVKSKLTPIQLIAANTIMDLTDTRPNKKKLQDAGITSYQYNSWLRDPNFSEYLKTRAENLIGDVQHEAMLSLVDRVMSGDLKAIEYYHELTGRFVRQTRTDTGTNGQDLQQMIIRIIEIIVDEVDSVEVANKIAMRLKGLVMGQQVAGVLPDSDSAPVEQPEIAAPREQTPEVKALMSRGLGFNS